MPNKQDPPEGIAMPHVAHLRHFFQHNWRVWSFLARVQHFCHGRNRAPGTSQALTHDVTAPGTSQALTHDVTAQQMKLLGSWGCKAALLRSSISQQWGSGSWYSWMAANGTARFLPRWNLQTSATHGTQVPHMVRKCHTWYASASVLGDYVLKWWHFSGINKLHLTT